MKRYYLSFQVVNGCNLRCPFCCHYADWGVPGRVSVAETERSFRLWSRKLRPYPAFSLNVTGGEPALHPHLTTILRLAYRYFPDWVRVITTNGLLLHRHPDLFETLRDTGTIIGLTLHSREPSYQRRMRPIFQKLMRWERQGVAFYARDDSHSPWYQSYRLLDGSPLPYDDANPGKSWKRCPAQRCFQLFNNRLWKCPQIAYLRPMLTTLGLTRSREWRPYVRYHGLSSRCSLRELERFLQRGAEDVCGMCPAFAGPIRRHLLNCDDVVLSGRGRRS